MKKRSYAGAILLFVAHLIILASSTNAAISEDGAVSICNKYALEGESIGVSGPYGCEGEFWICSYSYYGNEQNLVVAIRRSDGSVPSAEKDIVDDLAKVKFALDAGDEYNLFSNILAKRNFAIELYDMNTSMQNYMQTIEGLRGDADLSAFDYVKLRDQINSIIDRSSALASEIVSLYNQSESLLSDPDCVLLSTYLEKLEATKELAENFTGEWIEFIEDFNGIVFDYGLPAIGISDARIIDQSLSALDSLLDQFSEDREEYVERAKENLMNREQRYAAKEVLDVAYRALQDSLSIEAKNRYDLAVRAFERGEYQSSKELVKEAIALAEEYKPPDEDKIVTKKSFDYNIYFIIIAGLLILTLLVVLIKRKPASKQQNMERDNPNSPKKGSWEWVKEQESSMEKKASERLL